MRSSRIAFLFALASLSPVTAGCIVDTRAEYETLEDSRPVGEVDSLRLDLDLGVGRFELVSGDPGGSLYDLSVHYDRLHYEPDLDFSASGSEAALRFELDSTGRFPIGDNENDLRLVVSPDVVLELEVSTGVGRATMEFDDLQVRSLRYDGGVGTTEASFGTVMAESMEFIELENGIGEFILHAIGNTRVDDFRFEGGVGRAELDFAGAWGDGLTRADVEVGVGELRIIVPEDVVFEIDADESFLSEVNARGLERSGGRYRSGPAADPVRVEMRIQSGLGEVRIDRQ